MTNDNANNTSDGPFLARSSNFFNRLRLKVAMLASPSTLTPDEFFKLAGIDTTKLANAIVERYYSDTVNEHLQQFVSAMSLKNFADMKPNVLASLVSANSSLNDMQKAKICELLGAQTSKDLSYLR